MLDGAFCVKYNETHLRTINITDCYTDDTGRPITLLVLSLLACCLNILCMSVFCRQRRKTVMRNSLLLLSTTEVIFHAFFSLDYIVRLLICTGVLKDSHVAVKFAGAIINYGSDTFLCTRNWCNVLITAARTEVVLKPVTAFRFFTSTSVRFYYFGIMIIAASFASVRQFYSCIVIGIVKIGTQTQITWQAKMERLIADRARELFEAYGFFIFQIIAPVLLVLLMSIGITIRINPWKHSKILEDNRVRRRRQSNATRTILILAAAFLCCQMPCFIFVILINFTNILSTQDEKDQRIFMFISDLLLLTDSATNILIYTLKMPDFRQHLLCRNKEITGRVTHLRNASLNSHSYAPMATNVKRSNR